MTQTMAETDPREHPVQQPIISIFWPDGEVCKVGRNGITRIEATTKSGMYANIAYMRAWKGDVAVLEVCHHHLSGVEFGAPQ